MANSDAARVVRHVRCPRCHSLLQEPSRVPLYQCGGCATTLRAKNRTSTTPDATASTSSQAKDTTISAHQSGDLLSVSKRAVSEPATTTDKEEHCQSTDRGASGSFEFRSPRDNGELQVDSEKKAGQRKHSGEAAPQSPQFLLSGEEPAPQSARPAESTNKPSRDAPAPLSVRVKLPSPPRHDLQAEQDLAPLRHKILKTVDELKADLSELFTKSPDLNPTARARRPHLPPKQRQGHSSALHPAASTRARHAAAVVNHHGSRAAREPRPARQVTAAPPSRGLPSRRYRRCRADPCCDSIVHPTRSCHHGKPECSSCRGHCARSTAVAHHQEPSAPRNQPPRRPPPRHHCRPVLKGAPFIICSSCFNLVQVPADFAVSTNRLRKLRCGSCSTVLSYSYRDPARKKLDSITDQFSTDGSDVSGGKNKGCHAAAAQPGPFAPFVDDFGLSSYSTTEDDERPLHVSRNTSFDTVDGVVNGGVGRLHLLMGYGSASELLRHSPDLYESGVNERTTPEYDRKGKAVCVNDAEDDLDDSDDEDLKRSAARGAVWPLPGIKIKS